MSEVRSSFSGSLAQLRQGPRPRWMASALFILCAVGLAYMTMPIFMRDAVPFYTFSEDGFGRFWRAAPLMFGHIVGGTLTLILGPLQFSSYLRKRFTKTHRAIGFTYLFGVLIGAASAFYMSFDIEFTRTVGFAVGLFCLAVCWVLTAVLAFVAIAQKKIALHQQLMAQNYALTFSFVLTRFFFDWDIAFIQDMGPMRYITMGWVGWVMPFALVGAYFQSQQLWQGWRGLRKRNLKA